MCFIWDFRFSILLMFTVFNLMLRIVCIVLPPNAGMCNLHFYFVLFWFFLSMFRAIWDKFISSNTLNPV